MIFLMLEFLTYSPVRQKIAISAVFPYNGNYVFEVQNTQQQTIAKTVPTVFVYLHKKILLVLTKTLISQNRALFFAKN